jgi:hypothetical protein
MIPFFVCGGFAFCWYAMTNIRNSCALISADVKWIPSANVFLDNRFQTYWYLRGFVIAMPWFLQITILVIPPPGLTKLGLQDLFWAFWIGVALSFLFMLGTAVSARRATEALSQKWRELQGARSQR